MKIKECKFYIKEIKLGCSKADISEVTKSQRNRRRQPRIQIFFKKSTFKAWKVNVR